MISDNPDNRMSRAIGSSVKSTIVMGSFIAVTISWSVNHSILWCVLHGICGWGYVIYYAFGGGRS